MDFFSGKKGRKKKSLENGQPSSQSVRNRSGKKICLLFRASNRPLDGVKCKKKWSKNTFFGVWTRFWTLNFQDLSGFFRWRVNISKWAKKFIYRKLGSLFPGNERNFWPKIFSDRRRRFLGNLFAPTTPPRGGGGG